MMCRPDTAPLSKVSVTTMVPFFHKSSLGVSSRLDSVGEVLALLLEQGLWLMGLLWDVLLPR